MQRTRVLEYLALGALLWIIVDFTTTGAIRNPAAYYSAHMPALLFFYIGSPLVFSLLIYRFGLSDRAVFAAALIGAFVVEIVFTRNALLFTFPVMLVAIPFSISIYSMLAFLPKWAVDGELGRNKGKLAGMALVWLIISLASLLGRN